MSKPTVFLARSLPEAALNHVSQFCHLRIWDESKPLTREALAHELADVDGAMLTGIGADAELVKHASKLKVISTATVGYDGFDVAGLAEQNIYVTNTPYVLDETVADLLFGLILSGARRIAPLHEQVKAGNWTKQTTAQSLYGQDVYNQTLGIVGMGRIGEKIVHRAKEGFGMKILYHNRSSRPEIEKKYGAKKLELHELLEQADVVVVMVPLTEATRHLIGKEELSKMKETAILVNGARGAVIDEAALIEALKQKTIFGAALDVFEIEPLPPGHPLLELDNVTLTPHIGSATAATREAMALRAAENLVAGALGQKPRDALS
ncbi:D-glycerate dehydrogenase [Shouchella clausii]|uniref:2-hydroxyacid dehydrogenase n=1 Tax=Shouchella clausii TaxID=79880 RepID=UPI0031FD54E0